MMGGAKKGAANAAAPTAGSRRVVGTIAEAAAIARAAADPKTAPQTPKSPKAAVSRVSREGRRDRNQHRADQQNAADSVANEQDANVQADAAEIAHRTRATSPTDVEPAGKTVAHHILAERAYAYGRSIVEAGPEPKKPGETVEIES